ncbi:MAG TPA: hypothetical protein VFA45_16055 [Actinomycetes bacterium]|nr:hypothetical protein [Actinomycetes bacterium]
MSKDVVRVSAKAPTEHAAAVGLWLAAGYQRDGRVGPFVKSLV